MGAKQKQHWPFRKCKTIAEFVEAMRLDLPHLYKWKYTYWVSLHRVSAIDVAEVVLEIRYTGGPKTTDGGTLCMVDLTDRWCDRRSQAHHAKVRNFPGYPASHLWLSSGGSEFSVYRVCLKTALPAVYRTVMKNREIAKTLADALSSDPILTGLGDSVVKIEAVQASRAEEIRMKPEHQLLDP